MSLSSFALVSLVLQQAVAPVHAPDENGEVAAVASLDLAPQPGFLVRNSIFGLSAASIGDLDGDGLEELVVGAREAPSGYGLLFFFREAGRTGSPRHRIGRNLGGFTGVLQENDGFGSSVAALDDLDGDGIREVAVGAYGDPDGSAGAVWILFLDRDGWVRRHVKISASSGGFTGLLEPGSAFGRSVCRADDIDGDGLGELVVGAIGTDDGGTDQGAVWILFLASDGTVRASTKVSATSGGFSGALAPFDYFGQAVTGLGDLDGNGIGELAVGAPGTNDGVAGGGVWILFLDSAAPGTVFKQTRISATSGGLTWPLESGDELGSALSSVGDVDGDGRDDLVAGLARADGAGFQQGVVLHLFLDADGTVKGEQPLGESLGGFGGDLESSDHFGWSLTPLGDLDQDGRTDLGIAAIGHGFDVGALWAVRLGPGGVALGEELLGGSETSHRSGQIYARGLTGLGDLDGDGTQEVFVGVPGLDQNVLRMLSVDSAGSVVASRSVHPSTITVVERFGCALAAVGDLDGDGISELAVGASRGRSGDGPVHPITGEIWILFLDAVGDIRVMREIDGRAAAFQGRLETNDLFGEWVTSIGDFDGDGVPDLAIGAPGDDDFGADSGAVYLAFLQADGRVREATKISRAGGGLRGLAARDAFGASVTALGDLDGNGVVDLAVGAPGADLPYLPDCGVVWILFLEADGSVLDRLRIGAWRSGFDAALRGGDGFGEALVTLGDLDGDGRPEIAVGAPGDDDGGTDAGAVWLLSLRADGRVRRAVQLSAEHSLGIELLPGDFFGDGLGVLGDLDLDGVPELLVGAPLSQWAGRSAGRAWILSF